MAPPTGPRGGTRGSGAPTSSNRNARTSTGASRGPSQGGISKRSRAAPRTDRDGDLDMGASSARSGAGPNNTSNSSSRRGNTRSNGPRSGSRLQQNLDRHLGGDTSQIPRGPAGPRAAVSNTTLKVEGLKSSKAATNADGGLKSLVDFLEKKATHVKNKEGRTNGVRGPVRPVLIKKSHIDGDFVHVLASSQDAEHILKINSFTFAGSAIAITKSEDGWPMTAAGQSGNAKFSTETEELKQKLQSVLAGRYSPDLTLLTLNVLGTDPTLVEMGLLSSSPAMAAKTFKVLMALCNEQFKTLKEKREAVQSVSLADNALDSLDAVFDLAETFPDLKHLDLSRNSFSSLKQLNKWRGRFRRLETLLLNDNPIIQAEPSHAMDVLSWFPRLQNLSGVQVRTPEQVMEAEQKLHAKEIPQRGNDFRDVNGLGQDFITRFFPMYDSDRNVLLQTYYDEHSVFTLSVVNGVPKKKDTVVPPWAAYLGFSRNHLKITTKDARFERYCKGVGIQEAWGKLPATQHPPFETNKYLIDCHPVKGLLDPVNRKKEGELGMVITMHGEFSEMQGGGTPGVRSFSRTFILGPSLNGRAPIRVMNDMLSLHAYNPVPNATNPAPEAVVAAPQVPVAPVPSPEEQQQLMLAELSNRTSMTPAYSRLCLESSSWNFDQALAIFEDKKSSLPAEAFIQL
ncbi:unnamed protein product [Discula destructiva]